ncbi:hypothetical protein ADIS_2354 [Lunatimonas lonarensis]|uniref:Uncharacterized protein n=1 Tax=Lunatimonas lonarensis TaxID=1232681 RepID=R7ZT29_9BACT|nr:hypothetical protein ADIS_2354 [Lunatimonas lonarensis]
MLDSYVIDRSEYHNNDQVTLFSVKSEIRSQGPLAFIQGQSKD